MNESAILLPKNYLFIRRIFEISGILVFFPLILGVFIVTALAVFLDSRGGIFFHQMRPGKGGKLFKMWKFRSMRPKKEGENFQLTQTDDDRVTRVGKIIRRWRLDELPQFWNILRGEMSLIGPRPVPLALFEVYCQKIPDYQLRLLVRPGLTGLAQVRQGYTASLEGEQEKWVLDMEYIQNLSVKMDVILVFATVRTILGGFGAR
jgi:lipopolysaccharide/colanic/teichoic acid biosynthesis glycosyltransferase